MTMVQNSALARFFAALGSLLSTGWDNSLLARLFGAVGRGAARLWPQSLLCRLLDGMERGVKAAASGSTVCCFFRREGSADGIWRESFLCRGLSWLIDLPCTLVGKLAGVCRGAFAGSLAVRAMSTVGGASHLALGVFLLVMLAVPHAFWNNLYCVGGAVAILLLFAVNSGMGAGTRLETQRLSPWYILFMGFVVYGLVCSTDPALSVRYFLFHIACFLIVLLTVSSIRRVGQLRQTVALAVVGVTAASLYGCYQGWVGVEVVANQQDMVLNAGMPGRIYAFFDNPNNFAELLVMLTPFLLAFLLGSEKRWQKVLSALALAACVAAILLTYSRSSWLGLAAAVMVFLALRNWRLVLAFVAVALCAVPFLPKTILNRLLTMGNLMQDSSARYRLAIYDASFTLLKDHGLRGVGLDPDVLREVFKSYPPMFDGNHPIHAHNNYVQMWAELGLFGGLSYLAALLAQVKSGLKAYWRTTDRRVKDLLGAALGGFCGILLVGLVEYTWFYPRNMFIYWFLFGVIAACVRLAGESRETA